MSIVLDELACQADDLVSLVRRGVLTALEGTNRLAEVTSEAVGQKLVDVDDAALAVEYALTSVAEIASLGGRLDRALVAYFSQLMDVGVERDFQIARLELDLAQMERRLRDGDGDAALELEAMCRHGHRAKRLLFSLAGTAAMVLALAHRLDMPAALLAACSPRHHGAGQLAPHDGSVETFNSALDLLAHLAADPTRPSGADARSALLELAGYWETAGEAAIRLPVHLLTDAERCTLVDIHEARLELFGEDSVVVPRPLGVLRDSQTIENALWQAFDASHFR